MKRTTVMLPPELHARAARQARTSGISLGELVRDALVERLGARTALRKDPFLADTAIYRGPAPRDLAANHDKYLYGE